MDGLGCGFEVVGVGADLRGIEKTPSRKTGLWGWLVVVLKGE